MAQIGSLLEKIQVIHSPKPGQFLDQALFSLDTCQREIRIAWIDDELEWPPSTQRFYGVDGYEFLVRVAAGLESQVVGETDVFGQIKKAWDKNPARDLEPLFQSLFEDVKWIRSSFLQDIGGQSYGALVRKQLQGSIPEGSQILVLGAGALAASVVPLLKKYDITLSNRNPVAAQDLAHRVKLKHALDIRVAEASQVAAIMQGGIRAVIECVPWFESRKENPPGTLWVHLGVSRNELGDWLAPKQMITLDDLLSNSEQLTLRRSEKVRAALLACAERARLRSLSGQSWEDLAVFVS